MNTVATPCIMAVPSIFIVAPKGTVKEAILSFTLKFFFKFSSVTGIVAELLEVENAKIKASFIPLKKFITFTFPIILIKGKYINVTCKNKAKETTKKYFANSIIEPKPCVAKVLEIKQNIPTGAITRENYN